MTTQTSEAISRREQADRFETWLYIVRDEAGTGSRATIGDHHLADEGSDQLRRGEDAKSAADALAHCLNCSVAIVEKLFIGDERIDAVVVAIVEPEQEAMTLAQSALNLYSDRQWQLRDDPESTIADGWCFFSESGAVYGNDEGDYMLYDDGSTLTLQAGVWVEGVADDK